MIGSWKGRTEWSYIIVNFPLLSWRFARLRDMVPTSVLDVERWQDYLFAFPFFWKNCHNHIVHSFHHSYSTSLFSNPNNYSSSQKLEFWLLSLLRNTLKKVKYFLHMIWIIQLSFRFLRTESLISCLQLCLRKQMRISPFNNSLFFFFLMHWVRGHLQNKHLFE